MTNLTTEEMQRIVDGAPIADCIYDESGRYFDKYGNLLTKDGVWSLSDDKPDNGRNLSDLRKILAQQQEIERLREFITRYRYRIKGGEPIQKYIDELLGESDE